MTTVVNPVFREVKPTRQQIDESRSILQKTIAADIAKAAATQQQHAEQLSRIVSPGRLVKGDNDGDTIRAFEALQELKKKEFEQHALRLNKTLMGSEAQQKFMLGIDNRLKIGGPPFDLDWTDGVFAKADKGNGTFSVNPMTGSASAAVGVYLTPTEDMFAKFTAYMPITYSWTHWVTNSGFAGSGGGVGALIYDLSGQFDPFDNRAQLWNHNTFSGLDQQQHDTVLGSTSAAETYFAMRANRTYLLWTWCWAHTQFAGASVAFAAISCRVPFFVVRPMWL